MIVIVLHRDPLLVPSTSTPSTPPIYKPVAHVRCLILDTAYHLTNSTDSPWYLADHPQVVAHPGEHRSTSVGDLLLSISDPHKIRNGISPMEALTYEGVELYEVTEIDFRKLDALLSERYVLTPGKTTEGEE